MLRVKVDCCTWSSVHRVLQATLSFCGILMLLLLLLLLVGGRSGFWKALIPTCPNLLMQGLGGRGCPARQGRLRRVNAGPSKRPQALARIAMMVHDRPAEEVKIGCWGIPWGWISRVGMRSWFGVSCLGVAVGGGRSGGWGRVCRGKGTTWGGHAPEAGFQRGER